MRSPPVISRFDFNTMSHAHQTQPQTRAARDVRLPGEDLTIEETLRVLDVARQMRQRRETAEEMFRRDDVRDQLRQKLMDAARVTGDNVTEAEIDAAIEQYFESLHTYKQPPRGLPWVLAHAWIWRGRLALAAAATAVIASGFIAALVGGMLWFL